MSLVIMKHSTSLATVSQRFSVHGLLGDSSVEIPSPVVSSIRRSYPRQRVHQLRFRKEMGPYSYHVCKQCCKLEMKTTIVTEPL